MSGKEVLYAQEGVVATITLNRPKRGNALSGPMVNQFVDILNKAIDDPTVRIIV
ncbi:hypothetical protein BGZ89_002823, partial [Linnemannia elongata]